MIKMVNSETVLFINGRQFVLLYDDSYEGESTCFKCAFKDLFCHKDQFIDLVHLCNYIQEERNTFFVEIKP